MSDTLSASRVGVLLAAAHEIVDELSDADLTVCSSGDLLDVLRSVENLRRRLDFADYRVIREAESVGVHTTELQPSMARLLRRVLHLDAGEAGARVRAAANAIGLRSLTSGEVMAAPFAHVSAAQAAGSITQKQALVIESTIDKLPADVQADMGDQIEHELLDYAATFDAANLATVGAHYRDIYDPDGTEPDYERARARRDLQLRRRPDGTAHIEIDADPHLAELLAELLETVLDTTAAPRPAADGVKDARTAGQRNHDGLLDALDTAIRCGDLPAHNGVSTTLVLTLTTDQYRTGAGYARTSHGRLIPTREALRWGAGDSEILCVALNSLREITHYGTTHRIHTENQRHAIAVRDGGCTAPGCPEPPGRCQTHHVIDYADGGPTTVTNGVLACRWHHRMLPETGWHVRMINGRAHWIPPTLVDPSQTPRRNTLHDARSCSHSRVPSDPT